MTVRPIDHRVTGMTGTVYLIIQAPAVLAWVARLWSTRIQPCGGR